MAGKPRPPEKRTARWLIRPLTESPPTESFTVEDATHLASIAGRSDQKCIRWLHTQLNEAAETLLFMEQQRKGLSWVPIRKSLKERLKACDRLMALVDETDPITMGLISTAYSNYDAIGNELPGRQAARDESIAQIRRFRSALETTLSRVPGTGRSSLGPVHPAVREFIRLYERVSRQPFSFDYEKRFDPPWLTPGADFVAYAVRKVLPGTTDTNIVTAVNAAPQDHV